MSAESQPSRLVFKRTWSYRWIGAPMGVFGAVMIMRKTEAGAVDAITVVVIIACLALALGLWLPSRWAVWPLRVLAAIISIVFVAMFVDELDSKPFAHGLNGWGRLWEVMQSGRGFVLFSFPAMWFALTGRLGWREDQKLVLI